MWAVKILIRTLEKFIPISRLNGASVGGFPAKTEMNSDENESF